MEVADLYAKLGLRVDARAFSFANKAVAGLKAALVGFGVFQGAKFLGNMVTDVVEFGSKLHDLSQEVGVAVEPLQQLAFAGEQSGVGIDAMAGALGRVTKNAHEAIGGNKDLKKAFGAVGLKVEDLRGMKADQILQRISDKFRSMPDGPEKTALAMELMGKTGKSMIPVLNEDLRKLREEFIATGAQISGRQAAAFDEFGDNMGVLQKRMFGLKVQIVSAILPALTKLMSRFQNWLDQNRELIAQRVEQFIQGVVFAIDKLAVGFGWLVDNWPLVKAVLIGLVTIWGVSKLVGIATGVMQIVSAVRALNIASKAAAASGFIKDVLLGKQGAASAFEVAMNGGVAPAGAAARGGGLLAKAGGAAKGAGAWIAAGGAAATLAAVGAAAGGVALAFHSISKELKGEESFLSPLHRVNAEILDFALGGSKQSAMIARGQFEKGAEARKARYDALIASQKQARLAALTGTQGAAGVNIPITVNPGPGMDETALAKKVREKIAEAFDLKMRETAAATGH